MITLFYCLNLRHNSLDTYQLTYIGISLGGTDSLITHLKKEINKVLHSLVYNLFPISV